MSPETLRSATTGWRPRGNRLGDRTRVFWQFTSGAREWRIRRSRIRFAPRKRPRQPLRSTARRSSTVCRGICAGCRTRRLAGEDGRGALQRGAGAEWGAGLPGGRRAFPGRRERSSCGGGRPPTF